MKKLIKKLNQDIDKFNQLFWKVLGCKINNDILKDDFILNYFIVR